MLLYFLFNFCTKKSGDEHFTEDELKMMEINNPVILRYNIRPAQMLLLMEHD